MGNHKENVTDRFAQLIALMLSIPAFYLLLTGPNEYMRNLGRLLYGATAAVLALIMIWQKQMYAESQTGLQLDLSI